MSTHEPPCPGPHAHITATGKPSCTSHKSPRQERAGEPCKRPKVPGLDVCRYHGGNAPNAKKAAAERVALAAAQAEVARIGARRDIHPAEALIELVQFTAGEVHYWRHRVNDLEDDELTWGTTRVKEGGDDHGTTQEAKPNIAYTMLERSSDRLASYAAAALKAGVDERRVRLAESQGQIVAQVIRQVLDQLHLTEEQQHLVPTVVPAALRLIASQATP